MTPSYTQGSSHPVEMKVVIDNFGEDAFEAQVFIGIPQGLSYVNVYQLDGVSVITEICCICLMYQLVYLLPRLMVQVSLGFVMTTSYVILSDVPHIISLVAHNGANIGHYFIIFVIYNK